LQYQLQTSYCTRQLAKEAGTVTRPWGRRLILEGVVIIASILVAFALDRWWEATQLRAEEQATLEVLDLEFRAALAELELMEAFEERILISIDHVRTSMAGALDRGSTTVTLPDTALGWLYIPPTTQLVLGTRDGLVSSDGLSMIQNRELRAALAAWGSKLADMNEEEWGSRNLVFTDLDRVFRTRTNVNSFRNISPEVLAGTIDEIAAGAMSTVRVDPEILGVVASRYAIAAHGLNQFQPIFVEVNHILTLIERSRSE
jgi:hypothetical protein